MEEGIVVGGGVLLWLGVFFLVVVDCVCGL